SAYNNININSAITVGGAGTLSLTSNNANANPSAGITVSAPITVSGAGSVFFTTTGNSTGPMFTMGQGSLTYSSEASNPVTALVINNGVYSLVYPMPELAAINNTVGFFALATPINASGSGTFTSSPVGSFGGNFNGLGNTISNLTISTATLN